MRVLVCGGRAFNDRAQLSYALDCLKPQPTVIIEGGASGADTLAYSYARKRGIENVTFKADWASHGKAAGPMRNQRMIDEGKPDLVVAFPGGKGTADMVRRAEVAGIPVKAAS